MSRKTGGRRSKGKGSAKSAAGGEAKHAGKGGARKRPKKSRSPKGPVTRNDPSDTEDSEVRFVQPYDATKPYLCPGCRRDIPPGMGHMVVVPRSEPDLRRHWHRGCWVNRANRR